MRILVSGAIREPGAGRTSATALAGPAAGGNQWTVTGALSCSQGRTAAATWIDPAADCPITVTVRCGPAKGWRTRWPALPYATARTGWSNATRTGVPAGTVSQLEI